MVFQNIYKLKSSFFLGALVFFIPFSAQAMSYLEMQLYEGMDYGKIFDQKNVLVKYPDALRREGLEVVKLVSSGQESGLIKSFLRKVLRFFGKNDDIVLVSGQNSKMLDEALVADFRGKKRSAMLRTLKKPLFSSFLYATAVCLMSRLTKSGTGKSGNLQIGNMIARTIQRLAAAGYRLYVSPLSDPLEKYEILYAKRKRFLPQALQEKIENAFSSARKSPQSMKSVLNFGQIALNLPLKGKKLKPLIQFKKEVQYLLRPYRPEVAEMIKIKLYKHYDRFSKKTGTLDTPKSILYLQGPVGVGKSFVSRALARLMGADLTELTRVDKAESIIGNEQRPGSFLCAICREGFSRNAVILIDEIDRIVNEKGSSLQFFLPLLEPDAKYFYSPYLKANVDISHFCFVLAGNSEIRDEGLKSRATAVVIDYFSPEIKKEVIYQELLNDEIKRNKELMKKIDALIEQDEKVGIRSLRVKVSDEIAKWKMEQQERDFGGDLEEEEEGEVHYRGSRVSSIIKYSDTAE